MKTILLIGAGGAAGSILRYLTAKFIVNHIDGTAAIYGTLVANIAGCFLIGLFFGFAERYAWFSPQLRYLLITGLCGGYTTFSAFALENANLLRTGDNLTAFMYISASVFLCLAATFAGMLIAK
jgi:CrcB protein